LKKNSGKKKKREPAASKKEDRQVKTYKRGTPARRSSEQTKLLDYCGGKKKFGIGGGETLLVGFPWIL